MGYVVELAVLAWDDVEKTICKKFITVLLTTVDLLINIINKLVRNGDS